MADTPPPTLLGSFPLARQMARVWWAFVLRGVFAVLFGLFMFAAPGAGLVVILACLAAWLAVDGAATLYQAVKGPPERHGIWFWLDGIVSLLAAAFLLFRPEVSAFALVIIVGAWTLTIGAFRLILAFRTGSVLLGLFGALTVLIGAWIIAQPNLGLLALLWFVGFEALMAGVLLIVFGWRLRGVAQQPA